MPHRHLPFLLFLIVLLAGCDDPVSPLERTNPKDPKSGQFRPEIPTGLALVLEENAVVLRWLDNSGFEDGYVVEKTSATGAFAEIAVLAPSTTTFRDTSAVAHLSTRYRVSAFVDGSGERRLTSTEEANLDLGRIFDFRIEATDGGVRIAWHDNVRFEDGFVVDVLHQGASTELAVLPPNSNEYVDQTTPISFSSDPTYSIRPFIRRGDDRVFIQSVSETLEVREAFAPTDVRLTFRDEETVEVTWTDRSHFEDGFLLERSVGGDVYREVATLDADATGFEHRSLLRSGSTYQYRVRAAGTSPLDENASAFATSPTHVFEISAPEVYLVSSSDPGRVSLRWDHEEPLVRGYVVEREVVGEGPAVERARLPATARTYDDTDVRAGATYVYHVRTLSAYGVILRTQYVHVLRDERVLQAHKKPAYALAFSPDGRLLASGSGHWFGESVVNIWDLEAGTRLHELRHKGPVTSIAFSPDGRTLATGAQKNATSWETRLNLWDVATGGLTRAFRDGFTYRVAFHPDGELVGGIGELGSVWLWDAATGRLAYHVDWREEIALRPVGLSFNSDGTLLATSGNYFDVILRNGLTGAEVRRLRAFGNFNGFAFSPDDVLLAAGHQCDENFHSGEAVLINVASGREVRRLWGCALGFSPDGALYASGTATIEGGRTIHFRTVDSGALYAITSGAAAAFHPDGRRIAVALEDGSIHIRSVGEQRWVEL